MKSLSIVTTIYKSEKTIVEFCQRALNTAEEYFDNIELIIVDDGSPDNSLSYVKGLKESDSRIKILEFTRNFGHHNALMAGTLEAKNDLVFILDSDLEERPEDFIQLYERMQKDEVDIVLSQQHSRKGGFVEEKLGRMFYRLFDAFTDNHIKIPNDILTSRLITKDVVNVLQEYTEYSIFYGGIMSDTGYKYSIIKLDKGFKQETSYNFLNRLILLFKAFSDFSFAPLKFIITFGLSMLTLSFIFVFYVFITKMFSVEGLFDGYLSMMLLLMFMFSFQLLSTGLIGFYIWKVLQETKKRPRWIIKNKDK